eukprot:Skav213746  [mRNA]  locus=scaffold258:7419:8549:+ [translate_table: standard]
MGQAAGTCVGRAKGNNGPQDAQQLTAALQKAEKLLLDTETLERECDAHFHRSGLDAHGTMRRVELRRLLWTFAHSLGSTELTWEAIEAFAVTGTLEAHVPIVTREEFFRCVTKTVHLVAGELRRKLQELESRRQPIPRRPPETVPEPRPKTMGPHSSPWAAMAELSSEEESPLSSPRSENSKAVEETQQAQQATVFSPAPYAAQENHPVAVSAPVQHHAAVSQSEPFRPAPEPEPSEPVGVNGAMVVLVLSSEGTFDPQRISLQGGSLLLGPMEEAGNGSLLSLFGDGQTAFDLSFLEVLLRGSAVARNPAARMIPDVVWKTPESVARTVLLCFPEGSALCMWFQETEQCVTCCKAILEEALACGAQPCYDGLDFP